MKPRLTLQEGHPAGHEPMPPLQAIRARCQDRCRDQEKEVALCPAVDLMLYPIWQRLPRPRHFPEDPKLDRLVDSYNPKIGYFKLPMFRRNARDLRKGLFGPKGLRDVPGDSGGVMEFDLPNGWTLRLMYHEKAYGWNASDVKAEFIPPTMHKWPPIPSRGRRGRCSRPIPDARPDPSPNPETTMPAPTAGTAT
jgi:hypothetical protein